MTPRHAAKVPSGHVDAGAGDVTNNITSGNTRVPGLAGIDLSRVLMIAREQQLAGKIHACALPRKQPGIMDGCTATKYCPDDTKTRGQMPVFVVRGLLDP